MSSPPKVKAPLAWTDCLPTQNGWYWLADPEAYGRTGVVRVQDGEVHSMRWIVPLTPKRFRTARWYGPMSPPPGNQDATPQATLQRLVAAVEWLLTEIEPIARPSA